MNKTNYLALCILFLGFLGTLQAQVTTPPLRIKVNKSTNDAEIFSDNKVSYSSGDLELHGKDGSKLQECFVRFEGLTLADLNAVTSVRLEFIGYSNSSAASVLTIVGEIGNSAAYPTSTSATSGVQIKGRPYTAESVTWNTTGVVANQVYTSPDLKSLLISMLNNSPANNMNVAFRVIGNQAGSFNMRSYNNSTSKAPVLVINFSENGGGNGGGGNGTISDASLMNQLFINEVSSEGTLLDADRKDWIELFNNHEQPVFLNEGVFISDKKTNLFLHELKNITIPAKGHYTLLADDSLILGSKHLPFEVKDGGEKIYLTRLAGGIAIKQDSADTPDLNFNESYGRLPNGTGGWVRFITPTYGTTNDNGVVKIPVDFSHTRGVYPTSFNLTVILPEGALARYTLDGKTPTKTSGTVYSQPIAITKNTMVKVFAYYSSGTANSGVRTHTYFIEDKYSVDQDHGWLNSGVAEWANPNTLTAAEYIQNLRKYPIVSIGSATDPTTTTVVPVTIEYIDEQMDADNDNYVGVAGCSEFGQGTIGLPSGNIKLRFRSEFQTKKMDYKVFDEIPGEKYEISNKMGVLDLKEGSSSPNKSSSSSSEGITGFDDNLVFSLMKKMGAWAPATRFGHTYINGEYFGAKVFREGFDTRNLETYFGSNDDQYTYVKFQDQGEWRDGDLAEGTESVWTNIKSSITSKNYQAVKNKVEIEDYIRMSMLFLYFDMEPEGKAIVHNLAPQYSKMRFITSDNDGAVNNKLHTSECRNYKTKWNTVCGMVGAARILGNFTGADVLGVSNSINYSNSGNLEFKTKIKDEVLQHMQTPGGALTVESVTALLDTIQSQFGLAVKMDVAYLGNSNNYNNWVAEVARYKSELPARFSFNLEKWTQKALTHTLLPASINTNDEIPAETPITMVNPNANTTLYYTTDGSDPMGNDGAVSPLAMVYTNPITLPIGTYTIVTRAFKTNNWGPLTHKAVKVSGTIGNKSSDDNNTDFMTENRNEDNENAVDFAESVSIYPNPVYSEMHLDFMEMPADGVEFLLYDQSGKLQLANSLRSTSNTIPTFYLQAGNYYGVLSGGGVKHTFSVVKR